MGVKYPILNKIRPGHRCIYRGKEDFNNGLGFIRGKEYFVIDRLPQIIVFSTNKYDGSIDFGIFDGGDYFMENWEVVNEKRLMNLPDFDEEKEKNYIYVDMLEMNSRVK